LQCRVAKLTKLTRDLERATAATAAAAVGLAAGAPSDADEFLRRNVQGSLRVKTPRLTSVKRSDTGAEIDLYALAMAGHKTASLRTAEQLQSGDFVFLEV
jgi:hypothetical protein